DIGYDPSTGIKYYVQWVNLSFAIWDVTISPTLVYGPADGNTLWQGFGGPCETSNDGDPITLFDPIAKRWIMTQFALPNYPSGPFYQCLACSKTADPTGEWYRYAFQVHSTKMNDYPKFGVWPDAYYMSVNQFVGGASWGGAGVFAFDRAKILAGQPASFVYFDLYNLNFNYGGMLPADLDGDSLPPVGAPGIFAEVDADWSGSTDILSLFNFHVDWVTPANSTFTLARELPVQSFTYIPSLSIPQLGTNQRLDALGDRLMYRLQYRNFGDHQALVTNHTVDAGGGRAGVRWYELHSTGGAWSLYQQGTFALADGLYRWMGSVALDYAGNMALGYSVSSSTIYPSIRYTGRLAGDDLGQMNPTEVSLVEGTGNQTHSTGRWGDYSMMGVDPQDDCTFWYTQEYVKIPGVASWSTRIGSFRFPNCAKPFEGAIAGKVTAQNSGNPISQATVVATLNPTTTISALTSDLGNYLLDVSAGSYTVTVGAFGYFTSTPTRVTVTTGISTTYHVSLTAAPFYTVSGYVKDAETGWPLYAKLVIDGYPSKSVWTDPVTGYYAVSLSAQRFYRFQATAFIPGYASVNQTVGPLTETTSADFNLPLVDCTAPGRQLRGISADFEAGLPSGWTNVNNRVPGALWRFDDPGLRGNQTGGSGKFAIIDSDHAGTVDIDSELRTPMLDFTTLISVHLQFKYDFYWYSASSSETADVDVSNNGGITWQNVWQRQGASDRGPKTAVVDISSIAAGYSQVMVRFHYYNAHYEWWWQVDDVLIGGESCFLPSGGLVVGNVFDLNTGLPLNGVQVSTDNGLSTISVSTPDPAVPDGFYVLFASPGARTITVTLAGGYLPAVVQTNITPSTTQRLDINVAAGRLVVSPAAYTATVMLGASTTQTMTLSNTGSAPATFQIRELHRGYTALGPFERPNSVIKPFKQAYVSAQKLNLAPPIVGSPFAAGDVIDSWVTGLAAVWGVAYDSFNNTIWVSSPASSWGGENRLVEYLTNGTPTGRSHSFTWNPASGPADLAFNPHTGTLWLMNVDDGTGCIYEIDPATGYTGNTICPGGSGFNVSQRGLAYDSSTDTWYAGSWNDSMVYHFGSDGTILDQVDVGLAIAGLAYNPDTRHLFVIVSADPTLLYVLDAANGYASLGQFTVTGLAGFAGAGLELDCEGYLWLADQNTQRVYQVASGEATSWCDVDVPWLQISPITGTLDVGAALQVQLTYDASVSRVNQPGTYYAQVRVVHRTPYQVDNIPITLVVTPLKKLYLSWVFK
ncbi:MAG: carboxypeptidase regulatory-like domain-containing protein, partial [Anaerolineae bacterium]